MLSISIKSNIRNYKVIFSDDLEFFKKFQGKDFVFIIDKKIYDLYNPRLENISEKDLILLEASESIKTLTQADRIYRFLIKKEAKRNLTLVVIGGGTIQDLGGFIASTLYRGIKWIFIPTTLLAQTDSCIGSKTSLNFLNFKNIIGSFYPPSEIYICKIFLESINTQDFNNGLGEMIKIQLSNTNLSNLKTLVGRIEILEKHEKSNYHLQNMIYQCLLIKKKFIENDEFDLGKRALLNYGHTFGHALETKSNFKISHGVAVVVGMIFANLLSFKRKLISSDTFNYELTNLFMPILSNIIFKKDYFNQKSFLNLLYNDKKISSPKLTFIIPGSDLRLTRVSDVTHEEFYWSFERLINILKTSIK